MSLADEAALLAYGQMRSGPGAVLACEGPAGEGTAGEGSAGEKLAADGDPALAAMYMRARDRWRAYAEFEQAN